MGTGSDSAKKAKRAKETKGAGDKLCCSASVDFFTGPFPFPPSPPSSSSRDSLSSACCRLLILALLISGLALRSLAAESAWPTGYVAVDLTPFALGAEEPAARNFQALPKGAQSFQGVPFRVGRPVVVTGVDAARVGDFFAPAVTGLPVGRAVRHIHLLHATTFVEKDGTPLAKMVFHYADGSEASVRLGYGVHARAWTVPRLEKRSALYDANSQPAWTEADERRDSGLRLFQTALENPKPSEVVTRIDVVSLFSHATPFIAAITLEGADAKAAAGRPMAAQKPERKAVRDLQEFPDTVYRGELLVRVRDAETGAVLTNAQASLSITDDKESFYFGGTNTDTKGELRLPYPPLHAVGVSVWVHAPGRRPVVITESRTNVSKFTGTYTVALARGTTMGGVVKGTNGQPVGGARVVIHQVTRLSPHHYTRTDYDAVTTGVDGKWTSQSAPGDLAGFAFQVTHPEYRTAQYVTAGTVAPPVEGGVGTTTVTRNGITTVTTRNLNTTRRNGVGVPGAATVLTTNALLSASAEMILPPAVTLEGTLVDGQGRPVPAAEMIVQRPSGERKYLSTDAKGHFQTRLGEPGPASVIVLREGFAPLTRSVSVMANTPPLNIALTPARVLHGRVQDNKSNPVSGARVRLDSWNGTSDLLKFQTITDGQGTFVWTGAPPDQVTLYVSKTNFSNTSHSFGGAMNMVLITLSRPPGVFGKVFDAETKQPIDTFTVIPGRKYSSGETQTRWERSEMARGSGGEYALRMSSYYFQPEARVLVEAPGYEPQISRAFAGVDSYTNDFALKKGRGVGGLVLSPDGSPAVAATLVLVEKGESAMLDQSGQVRGNGGSADLVRSDTQGRFEFAAKLAPEKIYVSHESGFGEAKVADVLRGGKITLQKWGSVKGVVRVGDQPGAEGAMRLQSNYQLVADAEGNASGFSFSLKADPDAEGNFVFEKVPPGEHRLALEYNFKDDRDGNPAWSHGQFVEVKPGATSQAMLGGTGRRVTGRVKILDGEQSDVDWKQDVHRLVLIQPGDAAMPVNNRGGQPQSLVFLGGLNLPTAPAMTAEAMRAHQRAERNYVLLFDTNGVFRADHVPPGKYQLAINVTDPEDEYYNRHSIGALNKEVVIPDEKAVAVNAPFEIGELPLPIRARVKMGKPVPSFDVKTADGKTIKLSDFKGKPVLLHFWGLSLGYSSYDMQVLKEFQTTYGSAGKLVILGCNLDQDAKNAQQFAQNQGLTWTQTYLGQWDQTPVSALFGINGNTACVLIDAEGKLASGQLRSSNIRNAVVNMFSTE